MKERKIVPCSTCKVKKYNFDMIEKFPDGDQSSSSLYCSLFCLRTKPGSAKTPPVTARAPLPVISAVSSLAGQLQQPVPVQTQTVRETVKETLVLPQEPPQVSLVHSHWLSSDITVLSLVESFPSDAGASNLIP